MNHVLARTAVEKALQVVADRDSTIQAWRFIDPERALAEADRVDRLKYAPLRGVVLGVKDILDTGDQPTEYGSSIYSGFRPRADASVVALLRNSGAVCLGKTVTTEFACSHPGPTTNPHRVTHTPGGSSMGSAAAVASGMADVALGTQTAGSITRPASFCGVYGFKPTYGTISVAGVKLVAPSLDTVGWFARSPELLDEVRVCVTGQTRASPFFGRPRIGIVSGITGEVSQEDSRRALTTLAMLAGEAGADVFEVSLPEAFDSLGQYQQSVMAFEAAQSLAWERLNHRSELSSDLLNLLDLGMSIDPNHYDQIRVQKAIAISQEDKLFAESDILITPAALGEAPEGLGYTGDPFYSRLWTLLGSPTVAIPVALGGTGLPVGIQLVGRIGQDSRLLSITKWCARLVTDA